MVLNPELYNALRVLNRGVPPQITNEGVPATFSVTMNNGRPSIHGEGEHYALNCVVCSDTRSRLYVHHAFGQPRHIPGFNQPGEQLRMLAYCHNCQKRVLLTGYLEGYMRSSKDTAGGTLAHLNSAGSSAAPVRKTCPPMGLTVPVHEADPRDDAVLYLKQRGFDTGYLGRVAGAVVMIEHPDLTIGKMTQGRIGFPFYVDGELRSWQARSPFDLPKGKKWPPKWWFPGQTSKVPWNTDVAAGFSTVILCEGILSAVNMGPAAVAVCGKTVTQESMQVIKARWKQALIALDPDCGINREPGKEDFHVRMQKALAENGIESTIVAWTPGDNRDPGDLTPCENIALIRRSAPLLAASLPYVGLP